MISQEFHRSRRELYAGMMEEHSIELFRSGAEKPEKGDQNYLFVPDADFYYLTGYDKPDAELYAVKVAGETTFHLFIDRTDQTKARWFGKTDTVETVKALTGLENVGYLDELTAFKEKMMGMGSALQYRAEHTDLGPLRQVKTDEEIALHRKACKITSAGVLAILKNLQAGMYEYQTEAYFDFVLKSINAQHAFATIAASGPNACVLHYHENDRKLEDGDMILYDLGAEWGHYAADVSRTFPVNGTFSPDQKALYEVVLKGLETAIARVKPGQKKSELQEISKKTMAEGLIRLGRIKEESQIDSYYYHGSGHFIGLFTHDVGDKDAILQENMMLTLEPGLYFEEEGLGIRIEDTILVTKDGCEVLTASIPRTVHEIELAMKK